MQNLNENALKGATCLPVKRSVFVSDFVTACVRNVINRMLAKLKYINVQIFIFKVLKTSF